MARQQKTVHPIGSAERKRDDRARERYLLTTYGIDLSDFQRIYDAQNGLCAICKKPLDGCRIEVDHLHGTKLPKRETVRGLLCGGRWAGCNRKLGRLDKPAWLKGALDYVVKPPAYDILRSQIATSKSTTAEPNGGAA